jgi:hypothetical protein
MSDDGIIAMCAGRASSILGNFRLVVEHIDDDLNVVEELTDHTAYKEVFDLQATDLWILIQLLKALHKDRRMNEEEVDE